MRRSPSIIPLTLVCFLLGVLIVVQLRSASRASVLFAPGVADQAQVMSSLVERNAGLRSEVSELEAQLAKLEASGSQANRDAMNAEMMRLWVVNGASEVTGPGVQVSISGQINSLDMQDMINELRNAGAESIAVNGQRVVVRSVVTRDGNNLLLDGALLRAPYQIEAIGQPDTIEKALLRRGGLVSLLEYTYSGVKIAVTRVDRVSIPAYQDRLNFKYAQPVP